MLLMLCMMVSFTGCASIFGPSFRCPSDIKAECKQAQGDAKGAIESKGTKVGKEYSCSISKHVGEKKIGNMWVWQDPRWPGQYIGGMCSGSKIEFGCNPENMDDIWYEVEKHEFGHYWLIPIDTLGHNPLYRDCFINWNDPRRKIFFMSEDAKDIKLTTEFLKEECKTVKEGELRGFDFFDKDNKVLHVDFVGTK